MDSAITDRNQISLQVFCMCPDGFLLGSDWKTCEDIDECEDDMMGCDQLCINTPGSYEVRGRDSYHHVLITTSVDV